jgi:hypothetical protein
VDAPVRSLPARAERHPVRAPWVVCATSRASDRIYCLHK